MTTASTHNSTDRVSNTSQPWTILRLLEWTTDFFRKKGSESARLEAEVLLAHARDCQRIELYTAFNEEPTEEQRVAFRELVRRRGEGVPVAQLVGHKEFYSLSFRVDESTLIPRPETEHLVIEAIDRLRALAPGVTDRPLHVLDIGTGTGAIAISIAKTLRDVEVTAVDISEPALRIARWNADKHSVADRVTFLESDLLECIDSDRSFDLIASNPPYVSESEFDRLDAVVREHEPKSALVAGPEGTEIIERLLRECQAHLRPGGSLLIELSPMIGKACVDLAKRHGYTQIELLKDLAGLNRVLAVQKPQ